MLFAVLLLFCLLGRAARADQQWLVVSDIHLDPFDRSVTPALYHTDSNWPLFTTALDEMHRVAPDPPVIVVAGDFLAHQWADKARDAGMNPQTAAEQTMQRIAAAFNRRFPHAQFVIVLGNNDDPCGDYESSPGTPYYASVAKAWAPLVNRNGAAPSFLRNFSATGAYAARLPLPSVQAVAVDDVYWSILYRSCGRSTPDPSREQIAMLGRLLRSPNSEHTIVVLHIPPGVDPEGTLVTHRFIVVPFLKPSWNAAFLKTIAENRARLSVVIAGHTHRNAFRLFEGVPFLISPAISPIYDNNPGFLRVDVTKDGAIRDYRQYAYDEYADAWGLQSDFGKTFGAASFTPAQLSRIQDEIARDPLARREWAAMQMNGRGYREIGSRNWRIFWCAQTSTGIAYERCAGVQRRTALVPALAGVLAAALLFGLTLLILRLARHRAA